MYKLWSNRLAHKGILQLMMVLLIGQVETAWLPVLSYQRWTQSAEHELSFLERWVIRESPFCYYGAYLAAFEEQEEAEGEYENASQKTSQDELLQSLETREEGNTEMEERREKESFADPAEEYLENMLRENTEFVNRETGAEEAALETTEQETEVDAGMEEAVLDEEIPGFEVALEPAYTYHWEETWTEDDLRSEFFAVDSSTSMKEEYLDVDALLNRDLTVSQEEADREGEGADDGSRKPQILIYHTHASEAFADSVPGDASTTIVGAGDKLAGLLEEYGFGVLHHTGVYDKERDVAYDQALPALEEILEENPSIEVVIDLHRDEMSGDRRLVMDLQGRPTARFMFFNGLSYLRKKGEISYLENPYIMDNLAFSFQAQVLANEYYPGLTRKIYLKAYRYNMHLCPKSMLIELGAQNNTVEEIMNACDPLAHVLAMVLKKM